MRIAFWLSCVFVATIAMAQQRAMVLATNEDEIKQWLSWVEAGMLPQDPSELGTVFELESGVRALVSESVYDPIWMRERTDAYRALRAGVASAHKTRLDQADGRFRTAVVSILRQSHEPAVRAASEAGGLTVGFELNAIVDLSHMAGTKRTYVSMEGSQRLLPEPAELDPQRVEEARLRPVGPNWRRPWSSWAAVRVEFIRVGNVVEQVDALAALLGQLRPRLEQLTSEMMTAAQDLNDAIRQVQGTDLRGSIVPTRFESLTPATQESLRQALRAEGWALPGMTLEESLATLTVERVTVQPAIVLQVTVNGVTTVYSVGFGYW